MYCFCEATKIRLYFTLQSEDRTTNHAMITYLHTSTSTEIAVINGTADHVQNEQVRYIIHKCYLENHAKYCVLLTVMQDDLTKFYVTDCHNCSM